MKTKQDIVEQRKSLYQDAERYHEFLKGDRRVTTPRVCGVCGRPLASLVLNKNEYVTIVPHVRFHLDKMFHVNICKDILSCYRILKRKGEL